MPRFVSNISKQLLQVTSVLVGITVNVDSYSTEVFLKDLAKRALSFAERINI